MDRTKRVRTNVREHVCRFAARKCVPRLHKAIADRGLAIRAPCIMTACSAMIYRRTIDTVAGTCVFAYYTIVSSTYQTANYLHPYRLRMNVIFAACVQA